ncbi:MAG: ABC transporter substrate-binding protein [Nitrososphaerota archaeon]|nr:ABC transporter substrate-binding protein [Nitrososphaerota archaeon]
MKSSQIAAIVIIIIIVAAVGYFAATSLGTTTSSTTSTTSSSSTSSSLTTSTSTSTTAYGPNVTIAMTVSQSGQYQPLDSGYLYLNQAWQAYVNSHGGLVDASGHHHLVNVITGDDASSTTQAVSLYHQYAEQSGANVLVSPYSADIGLSLLPISQQDKVPLIMAEASTKQMWNGTWTWAVTSMVPYWAQDTTNAWSASYFQLLNSTHWAKTIGFVGWQISWAVDDYNSALWLANHTQGLKTVYTQLLQPNFVNPDFSAQIAALKTAVNGTSPPDIIYCAMFGPFCAQFITQAEAQGLVPKQWHTIEWGASFASALQAAGVSTANITSDVFWTPSFPSSNPGTALFQQTMQQASQLAVAAGKTPVNWYNYQNIELRWIIFQMINASVRMIPSANFSSTTSENAALNYALHHLNINTISGPLVIQPQGYGTIGLVTVQFQNNEIQTVYPSNVANATYVHP